MRSVYGWGGPCPPGEPPCPRTSNWRFIGVGRIAQTHLKNLKTIGGNEIAGACDFVKEAAEKTVAEFGGRAFTDAPAMLDAVKPDALVICTPPFARRDPITLACERGLPFFCEKPPAFALDDGLAIRALVEKARVPHTVGFMYRHLKIVERAREILAGETVVAVRSTFCNAPLLKPDFPAWFKLQEKSGGPIVDQALHVFDLLRYLLGDVNEVFAYGSNRVTTRGPEVTIFDTFNVTLRFACGADATHNHSWASLANEILIDFLLKDGHLVLDLKNYELRGRLRKQELPVEKPGDNCYQTEMERFVEAVRTRDAAKLRSPYPDALKTLAVCVAANASAAEGRPMKVEA
ncbi:MAG: Gfo/Idh/MocA family oxidoreductase [Planctomycetota bacterium]|nr:Gfo/Idh/MocA family oxidoreductase [Planctomycetota bacterium]